jgi:penicillin-binding protein 1A
MQQIGPGRVTALAERMGIHSQLLPVPSLALGTSEVSLLEMASAYGVFATNGRHTPPLAVRRVERADGGFLEEFSPNPQVALSGQTAYTMVSILEDVVDRGTATTLRRNFRLPGDIAGKTGTTQSNADGWFILVHPQVVVGAWVGFNRPVVRFRSDYWGQGGHNALMLAGDFMEQALMDPASGIRPGRFRAPAGYMRPRQPTDPYQGNLIDPQRVRELRAEQARADSIALSTKMLVW